MKNSLLRIVRAVARCSGVLTVPVASGRFGPSILLVGVCGPLISFAMVVEQSAPDGAGAYALAR